MARNKYSDDEILDMLRKCKEEQGSVSPREFKEYDEFCSVSLVNRRFGGWIAAKEAAGIDEDLSGNSGRPRKYTEEQIYSHLRECKRQYGKCTTETLSKGPKDGSGSWVSPAVVIERHDSWIEAKKKAGIEADERKNNARPKKYTDEEYEELLRECYERHGSVSQKVFNDDDDFPSATAVVKRFGKWSEAKKRAGISEDTNRYTREELLEMMQKCAERYGTCSANKFASDDEFCSPETLQSRFGSWNDAKEAAGVR